MNSQGLISMRLAFYFCLVLTVVAGAENTVPTRVPDMIRVAVADRQVLPFPGHTRLNGWLGQRVSRSAMNRLAQLDPATLLDGYRNRPGKQAWDGEHVGKWLHATTLAWADTGDATLRAKLDSVVTELLKCQLADGYLGTYAPDKRWTSWDVWSHKYNLIGLVTYVQATGNLAPIDNCRQMADLLCRSFGDEPGQLNIVKSGWHTGLASMSVLEPMVLLYRLTGEPRYLDFCRYLLRASEGPEGPKIVSTLLDSKRVDQVGNAKAYELLSCLNGVLEMYRTIGDPQLLEAAMNAWTDITRNRIYLTGAASYRELFRGDHDLPNTGNVGETCVTVTWLQLNVQLLRLTSEARFAEEIERVVMNQLLGAQKPDGTAWGYYVQMQGHKPYSSSLTGHCCLSSGPRGIALLPTLAVASDSAGLVVNLYDAAVSRLTLPDGAAVTLALETLYPTEGLVRIAIHPEVAKTFEIKLRIPSWCREPLIRINGVPHRSSPGAGYAQLHRLWQPGDLIELQLGLEPRVVIGDHTNQGSVAFLYGPLVLAADGSLLGEGLDNPGIVVVPSADPTSVTLVPEPASGSHATWSGARAFRLQAAVRRSEAGVTALATREIRLLSFADAGATGSRYQVWLPLVGPPDGNVAAEGSPATSVSTANGYVINDNDLNSFTRIHAKEASLEQWFSVTLPRPVTIRRVAFAHGLSLKTGGWFDTSTAKPVVEIQHTPHGPWIIAGLLTDYPETTATDGKALQQLQSYGIDLTSAEAQRINDRQTFTLLLDRPQTVIGLRVVGRPSRSEKDEGYELACAELQAFAR